MPYNNNSQLPESIQKLPNKAQTLFRTAFNQAYSNNKDDILSMKIAWTVVKKHFKQIDGKWVAKGMGMELFVFDLTTTSDVYIQKAENGEVYLEGVLSDEFRDAEGWTFVPELLQKFADQINKFGIPGFITHQDWQNFINNNMGLSQEDFIQKARQERKGILKAVKAIVDKGKLMIKAIVDKRYLNHIKKFNKMSIEAIVPIKDDNNKRYIDGTVLGLALDHNPINPRAKYDIKE